MAQLKLRNLKDQDICYFVEALKDPSIRAVYDGCPDKLTMGMIKEQFKILKETSRAIVKDNVFAGLIGKQNDEPEYIEVGYWILKQHRKQGIATKSLKIYMKTNPNIIATPRNIMSRKILINNGFVVPTDSAKSELPTSSLYNCYYYGTGNKLKAEYKNGATAKDIQWHN